MTGESTDILPTLAMRAHREGRFADAEYLCRQSLHADPDHQKSIVHLAVLLRHRGAFDESMELANRAIELKSDDVDGYVQLALCLLGLGRQEESVSVFVKAIDLAPNLAPLHHNLGIALENLGRASDAKGAFLEACRLAPNDVRARLSLGSLLLKEGDTPAAKSHAETSIRLDSQSGAAHLLMARIQVSQNKGVEAEASIRKALTLDPNSSFGHAMLGFRLLQTGDFDGAEDSFHRSIELDPAQGIAYFGITQARKLTSTDMPFIDSMESVVSGTPLTLEQASYLHYGLAKAYDNIEDYCKAMSHYDAAHRDASLFQYGGTPFDENQYAAEINLAKRLYTPELLASKPNGFESNLPIFIVGMMRSGTTLMEQILSSHPLVGAAGENEFWAKRSHEANDLMTSRFDGPHAVTLARQYCRELRAISPGASRITDKLPGNYLRLGLIHLALPNARIIHCRRSPIDTALSIYFTPNPTAPAFSHTKEGIGFAYRRYLDLMDHWRAVLPAGSMLEVDYEALVAHPERVIRDVLEFLGLEWSEACLNHDKNAKEVRTPSLWQVRQPIYRTSIERWRQYEPWLGPLANLQSL